ncbi:MAG: aldose 1-epimerase family protein [Candidatus Cryptobacteroides sp.]
MYNLDNQELQLSVKAEGAELCSIRKNGVEYLWQADPKFWKRHSPVLFPIVGSLWNGEFRVDGKCYKMSQHGFGRDSLFSLVSQSSDSIRFRLCSDEKTLQVFPYPFILEISYTLKGSSIEVGWRVENPSDKEIYFQIGAHPAFLYPRFDAEKKERGYFAFDKSSGLDCVRIAQKGCVDALKRYPLDLDQEGLLQLYKDSFDAVDTLILQDSQLQEVTLLDPDKKAWLGVKFDAPVVGLWSPPGKNAPFICIEPWYGRCDRVGYEADFKGRDWVNALPAHQSFETSYTIVIY